MQANGTWQALSKISKKKKFLSKMNDWDINKFLIKQAKLILHFYHACLQAGCVGLACLPACTLVRRFAGRQFTQRRLSVLCVMYVQTVQFSPLQIARLVSADIAYLLPTLFQISKHYCQLTFYVSEKYYGNMWWKSNRLHKRFLRLRGKRFFYPTLYCWKYGSIEMLIYFFRL